MTQLSPLRSFRLVCKPEQAPRVEDMLAAQGFSFTEEPFSPLARRLVYEPFPLGASIAARFGCIYVQDRSSMLPPLALDPTPGAAVLDMCASPGSKTGLLGQLTGDTGFVLGNEPSKNRLATLRRNLQQLGLLCCATASHPGEQIPLPGPGEALDEISDACEGWPFILLDPPCSGWGTVEKHPRAARLWQGDKVRPLITLQRKLLTEAARLLKPGGVVSYSTCTTNIAENEEQVRYAVEELGLSFLPAAAPKGFAFDDPALSGMDGVLRVPTGPDGQGFFVALLQKPEGAGSGEGKTGGAFSARETEGGASPSHRNGPALGDTPVPCGTPARAPEFFVRPWERGSRFVGERRRHGQSACGKSSRDNNAGPVFVTPGSLDGPFLDSATLPPGDLAVYNDVIHFLPARRRGLVPERFAWKGHAIGRLGRGGEARPFAHLRALMPDAETALRNGAAVLNIEDPAPLLDLLSGRSLAVDGAAQELGLYFRGLPLCRLPVKGRRAVLPPL